MCSCHFGNDDFSKPQIFAWTKSLPEDHLPRKKGSRSSLTSATVPEDSATASCSGWVRPPNEKYQSFKESRSPSVASNSSSEGSHSMDESCVKSLTSSEDTESESTTGEPIVRRGRILEALSEGSSSLRDSSRIPQDDAAILEENVNLRDHKKQLTKYRVNELINMYDIAEAEKKIKELETENRYKHKTYSVHSLKENVLRMETGLPTFEIFWILVKYIKRFEKHIKYKMPWVVKDIKFEDQILITLMKLKQNYTNLHLGELFSVSDNTISNIFLTFLNVMHQVLYVGLMKDNVPTRHKNKLYAPPSFVHFPNCRMSIDCTDIEMEIPNQLDKRKKTYSTYRGYNSFKLLLGVSPNAVITYASNLYTGSSSDKAITQHSTILSNFAAGDLVLADKGFLINDILPEGVTCNIPPFLENAQFTEAETLLTRRIARCRIHVERANQRLKMFKILNRIPHSLRHQTDKVVQVIVALCNLQMPLIKEGSAGTLEEDLEFGGLHNVQGKYLKKRGGKS